MKELTKEYLQKKIDHYSAAANAARLMNAWQTEQRFIGQREAYANMYDHLYPEMRGARAYELDEKEQNQLVQDFADAIKLCGE